MRPIRTEFVVCRTCYQSSVSEGISFYTATFALAGSEKPCLVVMDAAYPFQVGIAYHHVISSIG